MVIAALLSVQVYLRRSVAGNVKTSIDELSPHQFDPEESIYHQVTSSSSSTREIVNEDGVNTVLTAPEVTTEDVESYIDFE